MISGYKAIWFDAGDTLVTIPQTEIMFASYLQKQSIVVQKERIVEALNKAFTDIYYGLKPDRYDLCTPESDRQYWVRFYEYVFDHLGLSAELDEPTARRMHQELYELYISPEHYILFDDVKPVLQRLADLGFRMAVVSNFAPTLNRILEDKGVADYFEAIFVSTLVGYEKPDPRIYQHALDVTGIQPSDILYIGDHETNDIWAPAQVGIRGLRIKRYDYQTGDGLTSLYELLDDGK